MLADVRHRCAGKVIDRVDMHIERRIPRLGRDLHEPAGHCAACAMDEHVEAFEFMRGFRDDVRTIRGRSAVAGEDDAFAPELLDLAHRAERIVINLPRGDGDIRALLCKCDGRGRADAARAAGDECCFAVE